MRRLARHPCFYCLCDEKECSKAAAWGADGYEYDMTVESLDTLKYELFSVTASFAPVRVSVITQTVECCARLERGEVARDECRYEVETDRSEVRRACSPVHRAGQHRLT